METILFQETLDRTLWKAKNPGRWNPEEQAIVVNGEKFTSDFRTEISLEQSNYLISPFGHAWIIPGGQQGKLKIDWKERETLFNYRIGVSSVTPGKRMTKGTGVIAWLDQGPSSNVSSHHYFVLLNSDGKSPEELNAFTRATAENPEYNVLRHDGSVHAVRFHQEGQKPLYSYIIYEGEKKLALPVLTSTNKRLNVMFQVNSEGDLVLSVCDPDVDIDFDKSKPNYEHSRSREVKLVFAPSLKIKLISSTSGLPQTNPPLEAKLENNVLTYTTRNAVTDTFKLAVNQQ